MRQVWDPLIRARLLRRHGRAGESISLIEMTLSSDDAMRHWRRRAALLNECGLAEMQLGRGKEALASFERAMALFEGAGRTSHSSYAALIDNIGFTLRELGDLATAARWHEEAVNLYEHLGDDAALTRALINLAIVNKDRGLLAKARACTERAMRVAPANHWRLRGHVYATAALLSHSLQEFDRARELHVISLIAYRRAADRENEALELHNLAIVERLRERPAVAARLLRRSISLNEKLGYSPGTARDLHYLALFTFDTGARQEGMQLLRQAWHALAAVSDLEGMLWCELDLVRIGMVVGAYARTRDLLTNALARASAVGDPRLEYNLLVARGNAHEGLGEPILAASDYEAAIERSESLRAGIRDEQDALNFFRYGQWAAFDALTLLSVREGAANRAWRCCERAKTRELQRLLRLDTTIAPHGIDGPLIEHERLLIAEHRTLMAAWRSGRRAEALPRIEVLEAELSSLWSDMNEQDPEYVALRRGREISYSELCELLASGPGGP